MALRQTKPLVQCPSNGPDRTVSHNGKSGLYVHPRHVCIGLRTVLLDALIGHAYADYALPIEYWPRDRRSRPYLRSPALHHLACGPSHQRAHVQHQSPSLVHERRGDRQFAGLPFAALHYHLAHSEASVDQASPQRPLGAAEVVEEVCGLLLRDVGCIGDLRREIHAGERRAHGLCPGDYAGDSKPRVVGALVAHHLKRHSGHHPRLVQGGAVFLNLRKLRRKREQESCGRRPKSRNNDIRLHQLTFHGSHSHLGV